MSAIHAIHRIGQTRLHAPAVEFLLSQWLLRIGGGHRTKEDATFIVNRSVAHALVPMQISHSALALLMRATARMVSRRRAALGLPAKNLQSVNARHLAA